MHTPGPWNVKESTHKHEWSHWIQYKSCTLVAAVASSAQSEDNAKLIGAAPEMLEALKACLEVLPKKDSLPNTRTRVGVILDMTLKAIAKAEGKA